MAPTPVQFLLLVPETGASVLAPQAGRRFLLSSPRGFWSQREGRAGRSTGGQPPSVPVCVSIETGWSSGRERPTGLCMRVYVCVCTVSGRGRESRAEVGKAAPGLPQSQRLGREPGWPGLHLRVWVPGRGQAGRGLERAQDGANDQPALRGGAAAWGLPPASGLGAGRKWGRKQGRGRLRCRQRAVGGRCPWPAETRVRNSHLVPGVLQLVARGRPEELSTGMGHWTGGRGLRAGLSAELGLGKVGSESSVAFQFLGDFSGLLGSERAELESGRPEG